MPSSDAKHQDTILAYIEELSGNGALPIPARELSVLLRYRWEKSLPTMGDYIKSIGDIKGVYRLLGSRLSQDRRDGRTFLNYHPERPLPEEWPNLGPRLSALVIPPNEIRRGPEVTAETDPVQGLREAFLLMTCDGKRRISKRDFGIVVYRAGFSKGGTNHIIKVYKGVKTLREIFGDDAVVLQKGGDEEYLMFRPHTDAEGSNGAPRPEEAYSPAPLTPRSGISTSSAINSTSTKMKHEYILDFITELSLNGALPIPAHELHVLLSHRWRASNPKLSNLYTETIRNIAGLYRLLGQRLTGERVAGRLFLNYHPERSLPEEWPNLGPHRAGLSTPMYEDRRGPEATADSNPLEELKEAFLLITADGRRRILIEDFQILASQAYIGKDGTNHMGDAYKGVDTLKQIFGDRFFVQTDGGVDHLVQRSYNTGVESVERNSSHELGAVIDPEITPQETQTTAESQSSELHESVPDLKSAERTSPRVLEAVIDPEVIPQEILTTTKSKSSRLQEHVPSLVLKVLREVTKNGQVPVPLSTLADTIRLQMGQVWKGKLKNWLCQHLEKQVVISGKGGSIRVIVVQKQDDGQRQLFKTTHESIAVSSSSQTHVSRVVSMLKVLREMTDGGTRPVLLSAF
ncbi:hypothetical protein M427DRAFT_73315, partial [Gonapodya prolifera JEL478]